MTTLSDDVEEASEELAEEKVVAESHDGSRRRCRTDGYRAVIRDGTFTVSAPVIFDESLSRVGTSGRAQAGK